MTLTARRPSLSDATYSDMTDEEILVLVRAGDVEAYGSLWYRHVKVALVVARQYSAIADPEDIVQEAFQSVFSAIRNGGGPSSSFRPYLNQTVRNTAINISRRKRAEPVGGLAELAGHLGEATESGDDQSVERLVLVSAFQALPERWRTILWLTAVEDLPVKDAAKNLGLTPNAAAVLASRAREGLRRAWLAAHVKDTELGPACQWVIGHLPLLERGAVAEKHRERIEAHTATCSSCTFAAQEIGAISARLPALLLPIVLSGRDEGVRMLGALGLEAAGPGTAAAGAVAGVSGTSVGSGIVLALTRVGPRALGLVAAAALVLVGSVLGIDQLAAPTGAATSSDQPTVRESETPNDDPGVVDETANGTDGGMDRSAEGSDPATSQSMSDADDEPEVPTGIEAAQEAPTTGSSEPVSGDAVGEASGSDAGAPSDQSVPKQPQRVPRGDTPTMAPVIVTYAPSSGLREWLPILTGRGAVGQQVEAVLGDGTVVGSTTVGPDGAWSLDVSRSVTAGVEHAVSVRYAGSTAQTVVGSYTFVAPESKGSSILGARGVNGVSDVVLLVSGTCGRSVEVVLDGGEAQVMVMGSCVAELSFTGLTPGSHTVDVRYLDEFAGRTGAARTISFDVP